MSDCSHRAGVSSSQPVGAPSTLQGWPSAEGATDRVPATEVSLQPCGSRKQAKWAQTLGESPELHAAVGALRQQLFSLHPADWVAAYFLLCLSFVFPRGFLGGRVKVSIDAQEPDAFPSSQIWARREPGGDEEQHDVGEGLPEAGSLRLCDVAGLVLVPRDLAKAGGAETAVLDVLRRFQLSGVPVVVNDCLCNWAAKRRPLVLMDRVASAAELMDMQARGRRCLTCFCSAEQLGREFVDEYPPFAAKDAVHFAAHDLQHMHKFVQRAQYAEQVGFLHRMRRVHAWLLLTPRADAHSSVLFRDRELRRDVGHVVSDMNTCSAHMLAFLLAKWWNAAGRVGTRSDLRRELTLVLDLLCGDELAGRQQGEPLPEDSAFDPEAVRAVFHRVGCWQLGAAAVGEGGGGAGVEEAARRMAVLWPLGAEGGGARGGEGGGGGAEGGGARGGEE